MSCPATVACTVNESTTMSVSDALIIVPLTARSPVPPVVVPSTCRSGTPLGHGANNVLVVVVTTTGPADGATLLLGDACRAVDELWFGAPVTGLVLDSAVVVGIVGASPVDDAGVGVGCTRPGPTSPARTTAAAAGTAATGRRRPTHAGRRRWRRASS